MRTSTRRRARSSTRSRRIAGIVTEFTRFARLPPPRPEELDLVEVARQVVQMHQPAPGDDAATSGERNVASAGNAAGSGNAGGVADAAGAKAPRVTLAVEGAPPPCAPIATRIARVLTNLVQNALDAVKGQGERGRVELTVGSQGPAQVFVTVSDNGPGLSPANASRLFEPYATSKPQGTGLGLAIAQRIAIEHDGELSHIGGAGAGGGAGASGATSVSSCPSAGRRRRGTWVRHRAVDRGSSPCDIVGEVTEALVGETVDTRYELRRLIAHGGMGLVFEAAHKFTRRAVALKLLPDDLRAQKEARGRLLREAHALTAVRHPGFVEVLDAGVCANHGPYVVLEMLEGRTLDGILTARRRLSIADTCRSAGKSATPSLTPMPAASSIGT